MQDLRKLKSEIFNIFNKQLWGLDYIARWRRRGGVKGGVVGRRREEGIRVGGSLSNQHRYNGSICLIPW